MILSQDIPLDAKTFIQHCTSDVLERRYAASSDGYLEYLIAETEKRNKPLLEYVRVVDKRAASRASLPMRTTSFRKASGHPDVRVS